MSRVRKFSRKLSPSEIARARTYYCIRRRLLSDPSTVIENIQGARSGLQAGEEVT
jgi:hypothetical protein